MIRRVILAGLLVMTPQMPVRAARIACPLPSQKPALLVKLYFGQAIAVGREVSAREWDRFLSETITPRFPDGFTVYDAHGQWRDSQTHRPIRERSKVVEVAAPDTAVVRSRIAEIARLYRAAFHQQSVGIATTASCAHF
ncbi:MAG TPA: DUF3574 domain-containing protein [Rhizomicrobium sp.]|nr:DUF3574 domain-containing protein [Rhizomicrobium sp.]